MNFYLKKVKNQKQNKSYLYGKISAKYHSSECLHSRYIKNQYGNTELDILK